MGLYIHPLQVFAPTPLLRDFDSEEMGNSGLSAQENGTKDPDYQCRRLPAMAPLTGPHRSSRTKEQLLINRTRNKVAKTGKAPRHQ